jgi:AcrR family transcriptional regulator
MVRAEGDSGVVGGVARGERGRGRWDRRSSEAERRERTREEIIDATSRVVATRGPHRTTAGEIIEAAGVGRNTFYEHLQTSGAAVAESVRRATEALAQVLRASVSDSRTPRERLRLLSTTWLSEVPRYAVLMAVLRAGESDERASVLRVIETEIRAALELARSAGAVSLGSDALRRACVTGAFVAALEHVSREARLDVRTAGEMLADLTLRVFR